MDLLLRVWDEHAQHAGDPCPDLVIEDMCEQWVEDWSHVENRQTSRSVDVSNSLGLMF